MLNYFQNHNYSDYSNKNINHDSKNDSNIESKYLYFLNEQNKKILNCKNKVNYYEENSKFKNSKKIFKYKQESENSKHNTFDKEIIKDKIINLKNNVNINKKRNFHNLIILNHHNKNHSTINEIELFKKKEKFDFLFNIKNKVKDNEKYIKFKKEIFEKATKQLHPKVEIVKDINLKIKRIKNLNKKFFIKKPIIAQEIYKDENEKNKENINTINIKINNTTIDHEINLASKNKNKKENSTEGECLNISNKVNFDKSKQNQTISYKFNETRPEFEYDYYYFDISKIKVNSQVPKEYINIIYHNLLLEENKGIIPNPDYEKIISQKEINQQMRSILIDWIIDVHYKFGFRDETLFMTILTIDRYISYKAIEKKKFQLLGITALLLACKHEEILLPKIEDFIYITDNAYVKQDVFDMENDILDVINFNLLFPSPIKFYEYLALKFDFDKKRFLMGKYLMESFLVDLNSVKYRASVIACSCVYIVMKFYKMKNYKEAYDKKYYNLKENDINNAKFKNEFDIKECAKDICNFIDNVNKSNYLSCKNKYSDDENENVSLLISGEIEQIK